MDKLTAIKIKHPDGTYSEQILLSVLAKNVRYNDTKNLIDQLNYLDNRIDNIIAAPDGSTQLDLDLLDIKTGNDGITYDTPGAAVRANDQKALNTVLVRSTQPTENENKLWINNSDIDEIEILTPEDAKNLIADGYDETVTYSIGDYVIYDNELYRCVADIENAETWTVEHWMKVKIGDQIENLQDIFEYISNNNIINNWKQGRNYLIPSSVTNMPINGDASSNYYDCVYIACSPGDIFYITGKGGSGAKLWAWTDSNGNILDRAASNLDKKYLKVTAPSNSSYLLVNALKSRPHFIIQGELLRTKIENELESRIKISDKSVLTYTIVEDDLNSGTIVSNLNNVIDIGDDFPGLEGWGDSAGIIFKIGLPNSRKGIIAWSFYYRRMAIGTISIDNVITWGTEILTNSNYHNYISTSPIAYISNGGDFFYTTTENGSFTLKKSIIIIYNGVLYSFTLNDLLTASEGISYITVVDEISESGQITISGDAFALLFNQNTKTLYFEKASASGYPNVNKNIVLYYHRYESETCGLLVDYANRKNILNNKKITLPTYFENEVILCRDEIENASSGSSYVIGFLTDTHYPIGYHWKDTVKTMARVNELAPFDAIIHCGDIIHGNIKDVNSKRDLRIVRDDLLTISNNLYMVSGNHDDNLIYYRNYNTGFLTRDARYAIYSRMSKGDGRLSTYTNLFYDINDCGLRIILLDSLLDDSVYEDSSSWGFTNETLNWVENEALNTDNHVALFCHVPCTKEFDYGPAGSGGSAVVNGEQMKTLINNFITNGGVVVAFFHGHTHWDNIAQANNSNFKEVCTGTARFDTSTSSAYMAPGATIPIREENTVTQELWDTIVINTENRVVNMIRFGAGENRSFTY